MPSHGSNDEIMAQTNTYFGDLDSLRYLENKKLQNRWTNYIDRKKDYIDK